MSNDLMRSGSVDMTAIEAVIMQGDLKALTPAQRVQYHKAVCDSLGLNPLTKPFEYITLNGKLTLYPKKDATDQLRKINGISMGKPEITYADGCVTVGIDATDKTGRKDYDVGAVSIEGLKGEARANAIMKAITKSKRRVTLSICGLGWTDESEVESIPGAERVTVTEDGEILPAGNGKPERVSPMKFSPETEAALQAERDKANSKPAPEPTPSTEELAALRVWLTERTGSKEGAAMEYKKVSAILFGETVPTNKLTVAQYAAWVQYIEAQHPANDSDEQFMAQADVA